MSDVLEAIKRLHDAIINSGEVEEIILHIDGNDVEYRIIKKGDTK